MVPKHHSVYQWVVGAFLSFDIESTVDLLGISCIDFFKG